MKPSGTPVASIILSELHTRLDQDGPTAFLAVTGRGIMAPGVVIPNEWWDRDRLVERMEVDRPQVTADGVVAVNFRCRCGPQHIEIMLNLAKAGIRELLERELVPPLLLRLGLATWVQADLKPLPPATHPFGTPVDWDMAGIGHDLGLHEVSNNGMLTSMEGGVTARRPRVRVVDT